MVTGGVEAVVLVDLAELAGGAGGARAAVVPHQVVTDPAVHTRLRRAFVHVEFAVNTLTSQRETNQLVFVLFAMFV